MDQLSTIEKIKQSKRSIWSVSQVAELIGKSRRQVCRDVESGILFAERVGPRKTIIRKTDLLAFLKGLN